MTTKKKWSKVDFIRITDSKKARVEGIHKLSAMLSEDPERDLRLKRQQCIACWYISTIAGQSCTRSNCTLCDTEIMNSSTSVDAVCGLCAKAHNLCLHCGSDINLSTRRRKWPESFDE